MSLYTGKGDSGTTKLFTSKSGERLPKHSPVFDALGTLDELNSCMGWVKVQAEEEDIVLGLRSVASIIEYVQDALFSAQAELAGAPKYVSQDLVTWLEAVIAEVDEVLPPITSFLVPGGCELAARFDMARTITRRAERLVVKVADGNELSIAASTKAYLNRLSSLMFALGRFVNHVRSISEHAPQYHIKV
jgi:cob(I)alamin adenosyltransferase